MKICHINCLTSYPLVHVKHVINWRFKVGSWYHLLTNNCLISYLVCSPISHWIITVPNPWKHVHRMWLYIFFWIVMLSVNAIAQCSLLLAIDNTLPGWLLMQLHIAVAWSIYINTIRLLLWQIYIRLTIALIRMDVSTISNMLSNMNILFLYYHAPPIKQAGCLLVGAELWQQNKSFSSFMQTGLHMQLHPATWHSRFLLNHPSWWF